MLLPLVRVRDELLPIRSVASLINAFDTVNEPVIPTEPLYCEILNV